MQLRAFTYSSVAHALHEAARMWKKLVAAAVLAGCTPSPSDAVPTRSRARIASIVGSGGAHTDFEYDAIGTHLVRQSFFVGTNLSSTTEYTYDGDHVVEEKWSSSTSHETHRFHHDGDRLVGRDVENAAGEVTSTTFAYDGDALVTATESTGYAKTFTYDDSARLTTITSTSGTWRFDYDAGDRLVELHDGAGDDYALTYGADGRVTQVTSPQGQQFDLTYDGAGRVVMLAEQIGPSFQLQYTYLDGTFVNVPMQLGLDGNYELRNFIDHEGHSLTYPEPAYLVPNL